MSRNHSRGWTIDDIDHQEEVRTSSSDFNMDHEHSVKQHDDIKKEEKPFQRPEFAWTPQPSDFRT